MEWGIEHSSRRNRAPHEVRIRSASNWFCSFLELSQKISTTMPQGVEITKLWRAARSATSDWWTNYAQSRAHERYTCRAGRKWTSTMRRWSISKKVYCKRIWKTFLPKFFKIFKKFKNLGQNLIILANKEYGSGSSRDWAAKGPYLLGVRAVIAESFERIHRANLIGMGIVPLQFLPTQNAETLGLTGLERYTIEILDDLKPGSWLSIKVNFWFLHFLNFWKFFNFLHFLKFSLSFYRYRMVETLQCSVELIPKLS